MRIAVWHNLPSGGGKRTLYHQVRGMIARGHTVEVWCPSTADRDYMPMADLTTEHVAPFPWKSRPVGARQGILSGHRWVTGRLAAMRAVSRAIGAEIDAGGFDVVLAASCSMFGVSGIATCVHAPTLHYLGEPFRTLYEALPRLPWLALDPPRRRGLPGPRYVRGWVSNLLYVHALRIQAREELADAHAFDLIVANSRFSRESILRAYGLESQVLYPGVDTNTFRPSGLPRQPYVVGLGGLYHVKGVDRAIRALATIDPARRPPLRWIANVEHPPYSEAMVALARELGVDLTVHLRVPDNDVVSILGQAAALIYTSRLEPFGLAPLEANACETPVVAIAEGGVRETVLHGVNGVLVSDSSPETLGAAVVDLLADAPRLARLGKQARQHVLEHWTWDRTFDRLEHLCRVAIDLHRSRR